MTSNVKRRFKAGLIAFALLLAQVVMPVQSVFADDDNESHGTPASTLGNGTDQPVWCQITGNTTKAVLGNLNSGNDNRFPLMLLPSPGIEGLYVGGNGQVYSHDRSEPELRQLDPVCVLSPVSRLLNVSTVPVCGPNNDSIVYPSSDAVVYTATSFSNNVATLTATLKAGYIWSDNTSAPITVHVEDLNAPCGTLLPNPPVPTVSDMCGPANASWVKPVDTPQTTWVVTLDGRLIATASNGFVFNDNKTFIDYGVAEDNNVPCPVVTPCVAITETPIVSKKSEFADVDESRSAGHYQFTQDGLRIYTDNNSSEAKVAWYHMVNYSLSKLGNPTIDYTSTDGISPGLQVVVDFDGNGTPDGTLVGEAVYGNDWWLTNGSAQFVKDNAPNHSGGSGSENHGTLSQWLTNFPQAKVVSVGFSLGSGVHADGLLKSLTFGCQKYIFRAPAPTQCSVSDNLYFREWKYGKDTFPEAGKDGGSVPGTFSFEQSGLYINTPANESYVDGLIDAGKTPIGDVDVMNYKVLRQAQSAGYASTLPSYILAVDTNGLTVTGGESYFFYEPYNNDAAKAAVEGSFQTWDAKNDGNAKWWMSGTNQKLETWSSFVNKFPDAVVLAYGFNQGTYNPDTYTAVQSMTFDCATTTFGQPGKGNAGGEEPSTPPVLTVPSTPTTPVVSNPVIVRSAAGEAAPNELPPELPMTGSNGSILTTWVTLLAAVLTYGAVYYLQPKKRMDQ